MGPAYAPVPTSAMRPIPLAAIVVLVTLEPALPAQDTAYFTTHSDLVVLHATVTDRRSAYVNGLTADAFSVFEDGTPQEVRFFIGQDAPVSIGLVIDTSASMIENRDRMIAAVTAFAQASHPHDEFFALAFTEDVRPVLPPDVPFTSDPLVLHAALTRAIGGHGRTALYDAVSAALDHVSRGSRQRKVLVVISDGGDNASRTSLEAVLAKARASNAVIYTIGLVDPLAQETNPAVLRRLSEATGGRSFRPDSIDRVGDALRAIGADIRNGYTLGYVPDNGITDGRFRRIRVVVRAEDGRMLTVRTRAGYVAAANARPASEERR